MEIAGAVVMAVVTMSQRHQDTKKGDSAGMPVPGMSVLPRVDDGGNNNGGGDGSSHNGGLIVAGSPAVAIKDGSMVGYSNNNKEKMDISHSLVRSIFGK